MAEHRSFRLTTTPTDDSTQQPSADCWRQVLQSNHGSGAQQAVVLIFASLILDGGQIFRFCAVAAMASWVCTLMILLRRPKHPTNMDLAIVKVGFWLAIPLVPLIGFVVDLVR